MKPRRSRTRKPAALPAERTIPGAMLIDALYGLEPVFEPGRAEAAGPTQFTTLQCPYCGEPFETLIDVSAGSAAYIEDCQVCCQPIELSIAVTDSGRLQSVRASRGD